MALPSVFRPTGSGFVSESGGAGVGGAFGVHLEGVDELLRFMKRAPGKLNSKHLRRATRQGAAMVRDATRGAAPTDTGRLAKNIMSKGRRSKRTYVKASVYVRVAERSQQRDYLGKFMRGTGVGRGDKKDAYYWRFVEYGTKHQAAQPFIRTTSKRIFPRIVRHVVRETNRGLREELRKAT